MKNRVGISIGIKGIPEGPTPEVDFFELDALDPRLETVHSRRTLRRKIGTSRKIILVGGHYFLRAEDPSEARERCQLFAERASEVESPVCLVTLSDAALSSPGLRDRLEGMTESFRSVGLPMPLIDSDGAGDSGAHLGGYPVVYDPAWAPVRGAPPSSYWRIHGWHATRWIRLYPESFFERLARSAARHHPERISFGHSMRALQAAEFRARMNPRS
jgi:hypothetical protein